MEGTVLKIPVEMNNDYGVHKKNSKWCHTDPQALDSLGRWSACSQSRPVGEISERERRVEIGRGPETWWDTALDCDLGEGGLAGHFGRLRAGRDSGGCLAEIGERGARGVGGTTWYKSYSIQNGCM